MSDETAFLEAMAVDLLRLYRRPMLLCLALRTVGFSICLPLDVLVCHICQGITESVVSTLLSLLIRGVQSAGERFLGTSPDTRQGSRWVHGRRAEHWPRESCSNGSI